MSPFELFKQDGASEGCWAHNPEGGRSKLSTAEIESSCAQTQIQYT